jgi:hypothetical protein
MPEGPLEFSADTPRPQDGSRFDIYQDPNDEFRGTLVPNALRGRYVVARTDYIDVDGTTHLRLWYDAAPTD